MQPIVSSAIARARFARWVEQTKPIDLNPTWTEKRLVIKFGDHTYLVGNGQVFQCPHCGHYDPDWTASEVISFFRDTFGIKPTEIEVTCTVAVSTT